ncbi:heme-binding protein [Lacinutrix salivirga]
MNHNILKRIDLERFNNSIGLDMGLEIVNLAKRRDQKIAVKIERLNHTIFLFVDDDLPADKHIWLNRKANVAKHFEESSLSVKNDLSKGNMSLEKTFALNKKKYLAKGGAIPLFVNNAGMIAIITVSGLQDEEDHGLIIDALNKKYIEN